MLLVNCAHYSCIQSGRSGYGEHLEGNTEEENNGYVVLNKISTDQLENRVVVRGGGVTPPASI
jgi:hypothetical protein